MFKNHEMVIPFTGRHGTSRDVTVSRPEVLGPREVPWHGGGHADGPERGQLQVQCYPPSINHRGYKNGYHSDHGGFMTHIRFIRWDDLYV
jgi:hypothetical protein